MPETCLNRAQLFSPSEYTAALLLHIRTHAARVQGCRALDMGTGSGVVMAALLQGGAHTALGVELEGLAVEAAQALMQTQALRGRVVQGDMWAACGDAQFDFVATNLPQFAAEHIEGDTRLASWSAGGEDGRRQVDRFLGGLGGHLAPGGLALMTHNVFLDFGKTQAMVEALGLQARVAHRASSPLAPHKLASLNPKVLAQFTGQGIHCVGDYWFVDFDIVEISWKPGHA